MYIYILGCIKRPIIFLFLSEAPVCMFVFFQLLQATILQSFRKFTHHLGGPPST